MEQLEFDEFYAASFARVVGQVYAMTGNLAESQDCVQEAFVRAWQHHRTLDDGGAEGWVRTTAWRLAVSRWRRAQTSIRLRTLTRDTRDSPPPGIEHTALMVALKQIPAEQRRAIVLHHLCDLTVEQVAAETSAPTGTVKARLARGRAALAVLLDETVPERVPDTSDEENVR